MGILLRWTLVVCIAFQNIVWVKAYAEEPDASFSEEHSEEIEYIRKFQEAILDQGKHPLDRFQLLRQEKIGTSTERDSENLADQPSTETQNQSKVEAVVKNSNLRIEFLDNEKKLEESFLLRGSVNSKSFSQSYQGGFDLVLPSGFKHRFHIPLESMAWTKNAIFWIEKDYSRYPQLYFIDLNFVKPGRTELPIFNIPLHEEILSKDTSLSIEKDLLNIGGHKLPIVFATKYVSTMMQIAFSMTVNLVDMDRHEQNQAVLSQFFEQFTELLGQGRELYENSDNISSQIQASLKDHLGNLETQLKQQNEDFFQQIKLNKDNKKEQILNHVQQQKLASNETIDAIEKTQTLKESLESIQKERSNYRSYKYRLNQILLYISTPRPDGVNTLKSALLHVAAGIRQKSTNEFLEAYYQLYHNKKVRIGVLSSAAIFMGMSYPEESSALLLQSLDIASQAVGSLMGKVSDFLYLSGESIKATFSGFNPAVLNETYVADGNLHRLFIGTTAMIGIIISSIGIPHLLINIYMLYKDIYFGKYKHLFRRQKNKHSSWIAWVNTFIIRQDETQKTYIQNLQDDPNKKASKQAKESQSFQFSDIDNQRVQRYLELAKKRDFPQSKTLSLVKSFGKKADSALEEKEIPTGNIESLRSAFMNLTLSFSAFTNSGVIFATIWNNWFIGRTAVFMPRLWPYLILYPKFFKVAILERGATIHIPNQWNGGTQFGIPFTGFLKKIVSPEKNNRLQALEKSVITFEARVEKQVLLSALRASLRYSNSTKIFQQLNQESLSKLTDKAISDLSFSSKIFFQRYYHLAMERLVEIFMNESTGLNLSQEESIGDKKRSIIDGHISRKKIENLVSKNSDIVDSILNDLPNILGESFFSEVKEVSDRGRFDLDNLALSLKMGNVQNMDPRYSGQFKRYAVVFQKMRDPKAMARAVRASLANMIVDKPMELAFLFIMIAGTTGEVISPIHEEMFSENSWFHLSRYQFFAGYTYGLISGFLNNAWMKLQMDSRIDSFDDVPKGAEKKYGFWRTVWHNMKSRDNDWWSNQKFHNLIVWHNLGAALVTYGTVQFFTLGRLDLDLYLGGYLIAFLSPLSGLAFKIENAIEKSFSWVVRNIPKKYHKHPEVIQYSLEASAKMRFKANFFYSIYENTLGHLMSNLQNMSTTELGPRSFSRWVAGGFTFTEALINSMDSLAEKYSFMEKPAKFCRSAFLTNYTDGIKLKNPPK